LILRRLLAAVLFAVAVGNKWNAYYRTTMDGSPTDRSPRRPGLAPIVALMACLVVAGACAAGWLRPPADDSAEAGFARDMATHHAQAAEMGFIVRDVSHDEGLRALAYDIIVTQTAQRGMFMGWLQQWGLAQASTRPRMAWMPKTAEMPAHMHAMPMEGDTALMPGMATAAELDQLGQATGEAAEIRFLQLMIRHHEGGLLMARAVLSLSKRAEVVTMARAIDSGQAVEIALMKTMLAERGAGPAPSILE
jgi:uncharacterized protein (DUF305 family)